MNDKLLEWQKVIDLYKEGLTPKEISRKVSFDVRDICHKCREFEILGRLVEPKKCTFRASNGRCKFLSVKSKEPEILRFWAL